MSDGSATPALPVVSGDRSDSAPAPRSGLRTAVVLAVRWLLIAALVGALYAAARRRSAERATAAVERIEVPQAVLQNWFGPAVAETSFDAATRQLNVIDGDGEQLGRVVQTLPDAEEVTGYRGPSNLLVGVDAEQWVTGVELIESEDTKDHVQSIERSDEFFSQFRGMSASGSFSDVDVVSGATLTSLAMAEAIAVRLGSEAAVSSRFPEPIEPEEREQVFPESSGAHPHPLIPEAIVAVDHQGNRLGTLVRTGPLADRINGYQGPSELLLGFDEEAKLMHVSVRRTFDNQPYASYVQDEPWYWDPFLGMSAGELADSDLQTLGIEGVSGATMSTVAAAETLIKAAEVIVRKQKAEAQRQAAADQPMVRWTWKDTLTGGLLLGALAMAFVGFPGKRRVRPLWQVGLVLLFGFVTGNLLSIALLLGWGSSGVPWRLAPGLALVLVFALLVPVLTKAPIYCTQLCPHGAVQQWLRGRLKWQLKLSPRTSRVLLAIPGVLCVAAYAIALTGLPVNLASWEPFDAYVVWIGLSASVLVALLSLGLAAVSPMGYCRFACPTGRVLSYTRRHAQSGRWTMADWVVVAVAASAWAWVYWQGM